MEKTEVNANFILQGEIKTSISKSALQRMLMQKLHPEIADEEKERLSFYIIGPMAENTSAVNHFLTAMFGENTDPAWKVGAHVTYNRKPAIIVAYHPFESSSYSIKTISYAKSTGEEMSTILKKEGRYLTPISEEKYNELKTNLYKESISTVKDVTTPTETS